MVSTSNEQWLQETFGNKEWFHSIGKDQYGRTVVYVHFMNHETINDIPAKLDGQQVLVHFATSMTTKPGTYSTILPSHSIPLLQLVDLVREPEVEELPSSDLENDIEDLTKELDRLEKVCGSNTLQDIFYEIHDGKNAVTNLSARYPEVKTSLTKLYNEYGFDVIYEEMDG